MKPTEGHTGAAESDTGAAEPPKKLAKIPVPTPSELAAQTASAVRPAESDDASIAGVITVWQSRPKSQTLL